MATKLLRKGDDMKIPQDIKKIVSFVWIRDPQGNPRPIGTGFFVSVPNELDPKINHIYFVSAKHVFKDEDGVWFPSFLI